MAIEAPVQGVVYVKCPKGHPGGHIAAGLLGTQRCSHVLKSHTESTPEETVDGEVVKAGKREVADEVCGELFVVDEDATRTAAEVKPAAPTKGKLPDDFPGVSALRDAGITTYTKVRKASTAGELTDLPGIGAVTAAKISDALAADTNPDNA
jgi:hypothetical protein